MTERRPRPAVKPTSTSAFGVSKRENHDASAFYSRFTTPEISDDTTVTPPGAVDQIVCGDARSMTTIADGSVALVATSPPYFAGKAYEQELGEGHVPGSYLEYLEMLRDVFAECVRCLEPGGRLAVNVANLGRKPYRSLSADIIAILQDDLRLLLRGEVIWVKARGAGGNCAWGSFQRPGNPVLRDLSERIIIASKGRFDRALSASRRTKSGLPSEGSISKDEFMDATTDVWELPTESATRVGHPAPFPIELPERLIHLYTYRGDVVLDPFMGSGTTAVAAVRTGRHFVGYDTDPGYVSLATARVRDEQDRVARAGEASPVRVATPKVDTDDPRVTGDTASGVASRLLTDAGFTVGGKARPFGVDVSLEATDANGHRWYVEVVGGFTTGPRGLRRTDLLWRTLGKAAVLRQNEPDVPVLVLTTGMPAERTPAAAALGSLHGTAITEVLDLSSPQTPAILATLAQRTTRTSPVVDADEIAARRRRPSVAEATAD